MNTDQRTYVYHWQNGCRRLTPRQSRRASKKQWRDVPQGVVVLDASGMIPEESRP